MQYAHELASVNNGQRYQNGAEDDDPETINQINRYEGGRLEDNYTECNNEQPKPVEGCS